MVVCLTGTIFNIVSFLKLKKNHIYYYILPGDMQIIKMKEKPEINAKFLYSTHPEEKKRILQSHRRFKDMKETDKIFVLQNYVKFLKMDKEERQKLREFYMKIYSEM